MGVRCCKMRWLFLTPLSREKGKRLRCVCCAVEQFGSNIPSLCNALFGCDQVETNQIGLQKKSCEIFKSTARKKEAHIFSPSSRRSNSRVLKFACQMMVSLILQRIQAELPASKEWSGGPWVGTTQVGKQGRIQDFGQGGPAKFWPQGRGPEPKICSKLPEKCMIFK